VKKASVAVLLALLVPVLLGVLALVPATRGAAHGGASLIAPLAIETGHLFGYLALSLVVLEVALGLALRIPAVQKKHRIGVRWVHLVVGSLILVLVIIHVLTITG
jgi:hypothetical protein